MSALGETLKEIVPLVLGMGAAFKLGWEFFKARVARQDKIEDDEKKRRDDEIAALKKERDDAMARWIREVELGTKRAIEPAPRGRVPDSLPPPPFKEPPPISQLRAATEAKTLQRIRRGEPSPDDTLTNYKVDTAKPPEGPIRPKQISVVEVDGRRKSDKR